MRLESPTSSPYSDDLEPLEKSGSTSSPTATVSLEPETSVELEHREQIVLANGMRASLPFLQELSVYDFLSVTDWMLQFLSLDAKRALPELHQSFTNQIRERRTTWIT